MKAGRLKFIQSSAAGLDHCLVPSVIESDITVCSASGLFADQVAEQAMALLLVSCEVYHPFFIKRSIDPMSVAPPTICITSESHRRTGWKRSKAGRSATALSCFDPSRRLLPCSKARWRGIVGGARPTPAIGLAVGHLAIGASLNESTHHLIGRPVFEAMPKGSYMINVARGQVVDEEALIEALRVVIWLAPE